MSKKICFRCGKELGMFSNYWPLKNGYICSNCSAETGLTYSTNFRRFSKYLKTLTTEQCQELLKDPKKLEQAKIDHGYSKRWFSDEEENKKREAQKIEANRKRDKEFAEQQKEKNKKKADYQRLLDEFKADQSIQYGHFLFDDKKRQWLEKKHFLVDPELHQYTDIVSYHINQYGHNENKKHGITRAVVGGALAGGAGAIVGAVTGGKQYDVIDHLGVIINLKQGGSREIVFIRKIEECKANSGNARYAYEHVNLLTGLLDSIIAGNQEKLNNAKIAQANAIIANKTKQQNNKNTASQKNEGNPVPDAADEIRKFKKLADDGIITNDEFEAKKKQLLGL